MGYLDVGGESHWAYHIREHVRICHRPYVTGRTLRLQPGKEDEW